MAHLRQKAPCPLSLLAADLLEPFSPPCSSPGATSSDKSHPSSTVNSDSRHQFPARTATVHNPYSFEGLLEVVLDDKVDPPETPTWCSTGLPLASRGCRFANSKPVLYMPAPLITSSHPQVICKLPGHVTIPEPNAIPAKGMNAPTATAKSEPAVARNVSSKSAALPTPNQTAEQGAINDNTTRSTAHRSSASSSSGSSTPPAQKGGSPVKWKRHGVKVTHEEVLRQLRIHSNNGLAELTTTSNLPSKQQGTHMTSIVLPLVA